MAVTGKWYVASLLKIKDRHFDPFTFLAAHFAYTAGISVVHAVLTVKHLLRVSYDWRRHVSVTIAQGDIEAAFDNARITLFINALRARKTAPAVTAAPDPGV